jgi:6-pyruvoyltetrahydropterin/6-carboxytetrahydropterin synthase
MFSTSIHQPFSSRHFLLNEPGRESEPHVHDYVLRLTVQGPTLDGNDFLVDIITLHRNLKEVLGTIEGKLLNEMESFHGKNPSLEYLAQVIWYKFEPYLKKTPVTHLSILIFEDKDTSAGYDQVIVS